ncbi:N-acetyllactosaminide beta-1,3-N-acetylglucosaminyltransferase 2 [Diretmus argenteus]
MRRIQTVTALVLLASLLLVFVYSTLNLQTTYRPNPRALPDYVPKNPTSDPTVTPPQARDSNVTAPVPDSNVTALSRAWRGIKSPESPEVHNVTVSASFRKAIPQNGAYWNRLLHSVLRQRDKGGYTGSHCAEMNQELLQTNVHDFTSYPKVHQDFLQNMNCRYAPILIDQPNKCVSSEDGGDSWTFLLFAIKSPPRNFEQRQAVRETWGREGVYQSGLRVRTVFLLGSSSPADPDLSPQVAFEGKHFGDLLQWDFHESLFNLTLKLNVFLRWSLEHCPHVSFVFSGDDDVFVNTPAMLSHLQSLEPSKASHSYIGHVMTTATPLRDPKSKYYIPLSFYDGPYPAYAGGGGFLLSGQLLRPLYYVSKVIPLFPIDDVYTGMCCNALGVFPETHSGFQTLDVREQDRDNICVHKDLILIHQRSPQQIKRLWRGIHNPLLTC